MFQIQKEHTILNLKNMPFSEVSSKIYTKHPKTDFFIKKVLQNISKDMGQRAKQKYDDTNCSHTSFLTFTKF